MTKIATGETEKNDVVDSTLKLFYDKFINFRFGMKGTVSLSNPTLMCAPNKLYVYIFI